MAKFSGAIGYGEPVKTGPGVWEDVIIERKYFGDVFRNTRKLDSGGEKLNNNISVSNSISIVADAYAHQHFFAIKYVTWMGARWTVDDVEVQHPRLILRIGEVYNGETPGSTDTP